MHQMPLRPLVALLALALALSGCALNQPRPPMPEGVSPDDSEEISKLLNSCKALWNAELTVVSARQCASDLRRAYMHHDRDLSRAQGTIDRSLLAVAVAGVATATFSAHPDTTAALGLIGGTVGGVRGYYNVNARLQAMSIGRAGMNCILESSAAIQSRTNRVSSALNLSRGLTEEDGGAMAKANAMAEVALAARTATWTSDGTDATHAELIRQAINRVSEQVLAAYTFGSIEFKSSGTQIRQAVDDALAIAELEKGLPDEPQSVTTSVMRAAQDLAVDVARLNACGRPSS